MTDALVRFEQELISRNNELQKKAEKTITDATAIISESGRIQRDGGLDFFEDSLEEVLVKATEESGVCQGFVCDKRTVDDEVDECNVPYNANATVRLQRAKIQELERQLKSTQDELRDREKELTEMQSLTKELQNVISKRNEIDKKHQMELQKTKAERGKAQNEVESAKLEIRELKQQITEHEKEKRQLTTTAKATEVRYKRIAEELDRSKNKIESLKQTEKENKQYARKDYDKLLTENAKLERQKSELIVALRKQFKLIDILKRQKTHLEAAKCLSFAEEEFLKVIST
eukprot:g4025.t1